MRSPSPTRLARLLLVLALVLVVFPAADVQAAKSKKTNVSYFGHFKGSGEWQVHWPCVMDSYTSIWQLEMVFGKARIEPTGELNMSIGGASGRIDWNLDRLCDGNVESGSCSVVLGEYAPPVYLFKAKGGIRVDFELPLEVAGCGHAQVAAYGAGFESIARTTQEPEGFIPKKKIGKKTIIVPISGSDSGYATERNFSGHMSGTLELTRKKPLLVLPVS